MRVVAISTLLLFAPIRVYAQGELPRFAFNGHRFAEAQAAGAPWTKCTSGREPGATLCMRHAELLDGVRMDASYTYTGGKLTSVSALIDSADFAAVLPVFTKRYGQPRTVVRSQGRDYAQWVFHEGRFHLTRTGTIVVAQFWPRAELAAK